MHNFKKGFYYHYKHTDTDVSNYAYEVLNLAHHTEMKGYEDSNEGLLVIYRPLYDSAFVYQNGKHYDARPYDMFYEDVEKDGKMIPRFTPITDEKIICELEKIRGEMYGE